MPAARFAILVTWSEPEEGRDVIGPFNSESLAWTWSKSSLVLRRYENGGALPEDVSIEVIPLTGAAEL